MLESRIKTDPERSITSKQVFIEKLKVNTITVENDEGKAKLRNKNTTDSLEYNNFELFKIDNKSYSLSSFRSF
jgi:hypothetical protein